jgi:hypothetical protein
MIGSSLTEKRVERKKISEPNEQPLAEQSAPPPDEAEESEEWRILHANRLGGSRRFRVNIQ